jgi:hypothetical protein
MITMIIYFLLSRGKRNLSCEIVSHLAFHYSFGLNVYNILATFLFFMIK